MTDPAALSQLLPDYTLEDLIGSGSAGQVFRARHTPTGQPVVLRLLPSDLVARPDFSERFQHELRAASGLRHSHIIEIYTFGEGHGQAYILMELANDGSLRTLIQQQGQNGLPVPRAVELARQAATALEYAHTRGSIHAAIKPENMLLQSGGAAGPVLKIGDFGLSWLAELIEGGATAVTAGSPGYMSPEQCQGLPLDGRSDIYSFGVMLYEMVTGMLPFRSTSLSEALYQHVYVEPPSPRATRPELPEELEAVILRCLAKRPDKRYANAGELMSALLQVQQVLPPLPTAEVTPPDATTVAATPPPVGVQDATVVPLPIPVVSSPVPPVETVQASDATVIAPSETPPEPAPHAPEPAEATVIAAPVATEVPAATEAVAPESSAEPQERAAAEPVAQAPENVDVTVVPAPEASPAASDASNADVTVISLPEKPAVVQEAAPVAEPVAQAPVDADATVIPAPEGSNADVTVISLPEKPATQEPAADADVTVISAPATPLAPTPPADADATVISAPANPIVQPPAPAQGNADVTVISAPPEPVAPAASSPPQRQDVIDSQTAETVMPFVVPNVSPPADSDIAPTIAPTVAPGARAPLGMAEPMPIAATPPPGLPVLPPPGPMPQVQVLDPQGRAIELASLTGDGLLIGRRQGTNDLVLDADGVSDEHAYIDWDGREITVADQGSATGTVLGGVRLKSGVRQIWEGGVLLRIGPFWLRLVPALAQAASMVGSMAPAGIPFQQSGPSPLSIRQAVPATPSIGAPVGAYAGSPPLAQEVGGIAGITQTPAAGAPRQPPPALLAGPSIPGANAPQDPASPAGSNRLGIALDQDTLALTPGQTAVLRMTLYNYGEYVDHMKVTVDGVPSTWIQGAAPEVQLFPEKHQPVALTVNVPRTPENRAGPYPVTIYGNSRKNPGEAGIAQAQWTVQPFSENTLDLKPRRAQGWRQAKYNLILTNAGNQPTRYQLSGEDDEQALEFNLPQDPVLLEPGASYKSKLMVRGPVRILGSAQSRSFTVFAKPEKKGEPQSSNAQFVQRALLPFWLLPILLAALVALFLFAMRPPDIKEAQIRPTVQIAGNPATLRWEIDNASEVILQPYQITVEPSGEFPFQDATAIPPEMKLEAVSFFGVRREATILPLMQTQTPTPIPPTLTPEPVIPTVEPLPVPTAVIIVEPTQPPVVVEVPTPAPPVVVEPSATPLSPEALDGLREVRFCRAGVRIQIVGSGPPRESFLLYFGQRAVTGGSIGANGTFRVDMLIGRERPGEYPVTARLRLFGQPEIPIRSYRLGSEPPVLLTDRTSTGAVSNITCVVPEPTPAPTIAP